MPRDRVMGRLGEKSAIKDLDLTTGNSDSHKLGFLLSKAYPESIYREFSDGHTSLDVFNLHIDLSSHFVIPGIEKELTRLGITEQSEAVKELFSRDFTMNTILESLDFSQTFDLTKQGIGDINAGLIRCPIDPEMTIGIDARRILRAVKFATKFDFTLESKLKDAMLKHREDITKLPPKFVAAKIDEIVRLDADKGLDMLIDFNLLNLMPLSKMVNDILVQKRKVLHSLSSRQNREIKQATVKPVFNFEAIKTLLTQLSTLVTPGKTPTAEQAAMITDRITKLKDEIKILTPEVVSPVTMAAEDHETQTEVPAFWRRNLDYGERKTAFIRGDCGKSCPFSLSIPQACKSVGQAIHQMTPTEEIKDELAREKYAKANKLVYAYCKDRQKCPYADTIMDDKFHKVDCNYGDSAQGFQSGNWQGSPLYQQTFNSMMLSSLYSKPLGMYSDNAQARNIFYGLFSYLGGAEYAGLVKIAKDIGMVMKLLAGKKTHV